ncbi:MAG: hypothetical protein K2X81_12895, partial [Candidatus Obscuribacterales bacterium]|nr:hypothetical protein [Candidatus Obscuribacterales bacterium]
MFAADPNKSRQEALAVVNEASSNESRIDENVERSLLSFEVLHSVRGRIRLKVKELSFNDELARGFVEAAMNLEGITSVRANSWCGSVIICFDETVVTLERLLGNLRKLPVGVRQTTASVATVLGRVKILVRSTLAKLESLTPPAVQFALGLASFGSAIFGAPTIATSILSSLAVLPIAGRAAQTAIDEGKLGVDGLDGMAAILMIAQQNLKAASFMTALIGLGEYIRELTAQRCQKMLDDLLGLAGCSAWLVKGNKRVCIPAEQVVVGNTVVVYPGELVPVDGAVIRGHASVNQAALTGESLPVEVDVDSKVFAGTYLTEGKIYIR